MNESKERVEAFNFAGNRLCLDFSNTLHDRGTRTQRDHFSTYADLVWWSQAAGILLSEETQLLLEEAKLHPTEAAQTLQKAIVLRETMYRIFSATVRGRYTWGCGFASVKCGLCRGDGQSMHCPKREQFCVGLARERDGTGTYVMGHSTFGGRASGLSGIVSDA